MICPNCNRPFYFLGANYCPYCGIKVLPSPILPVWQNKFFDIRKVTLDFGTLVTITESNTNETKVIIVGQESLKEKVSLVCHNGVLHITYDSLKYPPKEEKIYVTLSVPPTTDVVLSTESDLLVVVAGKGMKNAISVFATGSCNIVAETAMNLLAVIGGSLYLDVHEFSFPSHSGCSVSVSQDCRVTVPKGQLDLLVANVRGNLVLDIPAKVDFTSLIVNGKLSGTITAKCLIKMVNIGPDQLKYISVE